jgi:hypothetical protein
VIDELPSDAALPEVRFDEQRVQLRSAVGTRHYGRKSDDHAVALCGEYIALSDLLDRELNGVRVGEKRVAIPGIVERGPPLQRLEHRSLVEPCRANENVYAI